MTYEKRELIRLLGKREIAGGPQDCFFLSSGLEGSDGTRLDIQLQIIRMLSDFHAMYHPFLCVQSFPIIQPTTIKRFLHMYRPLNYKKCLKCQINLNSILALFIGRFVSVAVFLLALIYQDRHCKCPVEIRLIKMYALIIQAS